MKDIHLYIGSREVEFNAPPDILYTYQQDDLTDPTAIKNGFSKTITIDGTPNNNSLFGDYWNVERVQGGNGSGEGIYFNASKKAPFTLYIDHDVYESGYVKLDKINAKGKIITYDITLYGGLGDFFYNLSINDDGDQLKLSDLKYLDGYNSNSEFDFTANASTVYTAWRVLKGELNPETYPKWNTINFMPCYNGLPDDFDSNKVIINTDGTTLPKIKTANSKNYVTKDGFVCGELPSNMTEWEVRDLRSYLQRPVIRMKSVINAMCKPENNGGYNVDLDPDFFNENNPYWEKTWLTLPMVQNLEYNNTEQILEGAGLITNTTTAGTKNLMYQDLTFSLGEFSQAVPSSIKVSGRISKSSGSFPCTSYVWFWNYNGDSYHTGYWWLGSLYCQLIALNGDTVVGASNVYNLTTPIRHNGKLYYGHNGRYPSDRQFKPFMDKNITDVLGTFTDGVWTEEGDNTPRTFNFTINNLQSSITGLKMVYFWGATEDKVKKHSANSLFNHTYSDGWTEMSYSRTTVAAAELTITNMNTNIQAVIGGSLGRTGTEINKALLLNTEHSPCEYLLSYTKMFGLYFVKEPTENTIHIMTRKTFYNREENDIVDLNKLIDRSKDITITPIAFETKWYQFKQDADETQFYSNYFAKRGVEYGSKILNTGYEFNAEKKQLLEDNVIKSAVEGMEKSKYFTAYNNDNVIRPWFGYGLTYNLYNGEDTVTVTATTANAGTIYGINEEEGMKYYDLFPKVQFHDKDNKGTDGKDCLVFYSGKKEVQLNRSISLSYYLTDDTPAQKQLNEGTPCWLFTTKEYVNGVRIAYRMHTIPVFERYLTGQNSGKVTRSLDFGSAQELFIPTYSLTDDVNLYSNFWKTYLEDLYDVNTKVLKCFCKIEGKPNHEWLSRFYWFDNAIWRISKITDWNPSSYDTTQVEFVKVQDIADYTSITQRKANSVILTSDTYTVDPNGGVATLTVTQEGSAPRRVRIISDSEGVVIEQTGEDEYTATISQNNTADDRGFYVTAVDEEGNNSRIYIRQTYEGSTTLAVTPNTLIVPASGGTYSVNFEWFNQDVNYIDDYDVYGDIVATADVLTEQESNEATITVSASTADTVVSGLVMFDNGEYNVSTYIDQVPASLYFDASGNSQSLTFTYANTVAFVNLPYWLTVSNSGDTFTLTAEANLYEAAREAELIVNDGYSEAAIIVSQASGGLNQRYATNVTPTNIYLNGAWTNDGVYMTITCNEPWTITDVSASWINLSHMQGDAGINVVLVYPASLGTNRSGTFKVNIGDVSYIIYVFQGGSGSASLTVSPTTTSVPSGQSTVDITVNYHGRNGFNVVPQPSSTACTCTPISWTGETGTTTATIAENDTAATRTITVTFTGATTALTASTVISQAAADPAASFSPNYLLLGGGFTSSSATITTNTSWSATTTPASGWLYIAFSGSGQVAGHTLTGDTSADIVVSATVNRTGSIRRGSVNLYDGSGQTLLATLSVTQTTNDLSTLSVSPSSVMFRAQSGSTDVNVTTSFIVDEWNLVGTIPSWLLIYPTSGTGNTTVTITASSNPSVSSRSASFTIEDEGGRVAFLNVSQDGVQQNPSASVSSDSLYFDCDETFVRLDSVTSNVSWTATTDESWIFIDQASGTSGTSNIGISVAENLLRYGRSGNVYIRNKSTNAVLTTISVTQYGTDPRPHPEPYDPVL